MENLDFDICSNCKKELEIGLRGYIGINPIKPSDFKLIPTLCEDCLTPLEDCVIGNIWGDSNCENVSREEWFEKNVKTTVIEAQKQNKNILVIGFYTELIENFKILEISNLEKIEKFIENFEEHKENNIDSLFFV